MQVASLSATASIWTIQLVSSHTSKSICNCIQLNYTGLTMCKQQVPLLQHPSSQKGWLCAKNISICCSIHLVKRVDYMQTTSPSLHMTLRSKFLSNRINYFYWHSFQPVFNMGFLRCEGKCFSPCCLLFSLWFTMLLWNHVCFRGHHSPEVVDCYLSLRSGDLTNSSSHICGSWYLPIFLFKDGSLTLISIASLMSLMILVLTAHYTKIVQRQFMTSDVVMVMDGLGGPHMFSEPFMFCLIPLCTLLLSPPCHTWIFTSLHSSLRWCLYL